MPEVIDFIYFRRLVARVAYSTEICFFNILVHNLFAVHMLKIHHVIFFVQRPTYSAN